MKRLLWLTLLLGIVFSHAPNLMAADAAKQCEQLTSQEKFKEAFSLCKQAAEQGDARGQSIFGWMYLNGHGVAQDYGEAVKWWRKAAEQGNADAQFGLGLAYAGGLGVLRSGTAAADWYYKAGLSFLKDGNKEMALTSVEKIKDLQKKGMSVPNAFLADKLLTAIYGDSPERQE